MLFGISLQSLILLSYYFLKNTEISPNTCWMSFFFFFFLVIQLNISSNVLLIYEYLCYEVGIIIPIFQTEMCRKVKQFPKLQGWQD